MSVKLYNPKAHSPAIYMPNWLCQIPITDLSFGAKILYSRLVHWCNEKGKVYRSAANLGLEIGASKSSIEKYTKELKKVGLISTYQNQKGGQNNFEFHKHLWQDAPIIKELHYINDLAHTPPVKDAVIHNAPIKRVLSPVKRGAPPVRSYGTPPPDLTVINNKEIKRSSSSSFNGALEKSSPTTTEKNELKEKNQPQPKNPVTRNGGFGKFLTDLRQRVFEQKEKEGEKEREREREKEDEKEIKPTSNKELLTTNAEAVALFNQKFSGTGATIDKLYDKFFTLNPVEKRTVSRFLGFLRLEREDKWEKVSLPEREVSADEDSARKIFAEDRQPLTFLDRALIDEWKAAHENNQLEEAKLKMTMAQKDRIHKILDFIKHGIPLDHRTVENKGGIFELQLTRLMG